MSDSLFLLTPDEFPDQLIRPLRLPNRTCWPPGVEAQGGQTTEVLD